MFQEIVVNVSFLKHTLTKKDTGVVEGDYNSTKLIFNFEDEIKEGYKVRFKLSNPAGEIVLLEEIKDLTKPEVILAGYDEGGNVYSLFAESGLYPFELVLFDDDSKLTSAPGWINAAQRQVNSGQGGGAAYYLPMLDEIITKFGDLDNPSAGGGVPTGLIRYWKPNILYKENDIVLSAFTAGDYAYWMVLTCMKDHTSVDAQEDMLSGCWIGQYLNSYSAMFDGDGNRIMTSYAPVIRESTRGCAIATKSAILTGQGNQTIDCKLISRNIFNAESYIDTTVSNLYTINKNGTVTTENSLDEGGRVAFDFPLEAGESYGFYIRHDGNSSPTLDLFRDHGTDDQKRIEIEPTIDSDGCSVYQFTFDKLARSSSIRIDFSSNPASSDTLEICIVKGSIAPHKYLNSVPNKVDENGNREFNFDILQYEGNLIDDTKRQYSTGSPENIFFGTINIYNSRTLLPPGTYTLSAKVRDGLGINLYALEHTGGVSFSVLKQAAKSTLTFTLKKPTSCVFKVYHSSYSSADDLEWAKLEVGTYATDYKPYADPIVHTIFTGSTTKAQVKVTKDTTLIVHEEEYELSTTYRADTKSYIDNKFAELLGGK